MKSVAVSGAECPILVLAEQCCSDAGERVGLAQSQSLFERIIEFDLATASDHEDSTRSSSSSLAILTRFRFVRNLRFLW